MLAEGSVLLGCPPYGGFFILFLGGFMKSVLTIAGSDSSGGAGIQADLKTMIANGVYGMSVITALTAQNTMGVDGILEIDSDFVGLQLDSVFEDIRPDAIKIGMVSSVDSIKIIAERLKKYKAKNIVLDPVMVATSGADLIKKDSVRVLKENLFPIATLITPNIIEANVLSGIKIESKEDMISAAKSIFDTYKCPILIKGGHSKDNSDDLLYHAKGYKWYEAKRIDNPNTHGTGCTISSAIASNLSKGYSLEKSVANAKAYITSAIKSKLNIGNGRGPLNHGFAIKEFDF